MMQWLIRLIFLGPVVAGLIGLILPAFGYAPILGASSFSLAAFEQVARWPGIKAASWLSIQVGLLATLISLTIVIGFLASFHSSRAMTWIQRILSPILAMPHAAAAFGVAFMIAPSGWLSRAASPTLTGWERPPDLLILGDPNGLALVLGLVAKEVPFLLFMSLAAMGQVRVRQSLQISESLGYRRETAWLKTVLPLVYRQIRIPVYVVLAFSMTVVDAALILGPSTPPLLSVQILRWMNDPDLSQRLVGAAAGIWQTVLVLATIGFWRVLELIISRLFASWSAGGHRTRLAMTTKVVGGLGVGAGIVLMLGSMALLALWSVSAQWSFPSAWPDALSTRNWERQSSDLWRAVKDTAFVAIATCMIALTVAIAALSLWRGRIGNSIYLPLLIPQIVFLPGLQLLLLLVGWRSGAGPVIAAHFVFVFPYVMLSLSGPWQALDSKFERSAASLGAGPIRQLFTVRLPLLTKPLLAAVALALAVSVGQYLPTLLMGGGRLQTLTTEAVALASGGNRRVQSIWASAQIFASTLPFALAILIPHILFRNRRDLR